MKDFLYWQTKNCDFPYHDIFLCQHLSLKTFILTAFILLLLCNHIFADEWYAMARHGGCIALKEIASRDEDFKGAVTFEDIQAVLEEKDINFTIEPLIKGQDGIYLFNVPDKGWAMTIAKREYCNVTGNR